MKTLYCWRCKMEVPMLDEVEFVEVSRRFRDGLAGVQDRGRGIGDVIGTFDPSYVFAEALSAYERITGFRETNPNAIWHHRLSLYGPPCVVCGRPLRTPRARFCAECGATRTDQAR